MCLKWFIIIITIIMICLIEARPLHLHETSLPPSISLQHCTLLEQSQLSCLLFQYKTQANTKRDTGNFHLLLQSETALSIPILSEYESASSLLMSLQSLQCIRDNLLETFSSFPILKCIALYWILCLGAPSQLLFSNSCCNPKAFPSSSCKNPNPSPLVWFDQPLLSILTLLHGNAPMFPEQHYYIILYSCFKNDTKDL